ncbi:MAG: hypothetical protein WD407_09260 [Rhodospirillales bacterium]
MKLYGPINDEFALTFGRIIAAWGYLEAVLSEGTEGFYHNQTMEMEGYLSAQLDYPRKRDLFKALCELQGTSEEFEPHIKEIERLNKIRGIVAHSYWTEGQRPGAIKPLGVSGRRKMKYLGLEHNEKEWTVTELNLEAEAIMTEAKSFLRLLVHHGLAAE